MLRLETDIQSLEQHLENMRATYQLNQEKLNYNFRVLTERDAENQFTISQQKRKVAHQRDTLSSLKVRGLPTCDEAIPVCCPCTGQLMS